MVKWLLPLLFGFLPLLVLGQQFCVYNQSDVTVKAEMTGGLCMEFYADPGANPCPSIPTLCQVVSQPIDIRAEKYNNIICSYKKDTSNSIWISVHGSNGNYYCQ